MDGTAIFPENRKFSDSARFQADDACSLRGSTRPGTSASSA
jgi:hypothetical protein